MSLKRTYLLVVILCHVVSGWTKSTVSNTFTTADGLSDNSALCAFRDSYGFLWIGTENGLNCYDGQRMRAYRDIADTNSSLESSTVMSLQEYKQDIWFGGTLGLYVFDRKENKVSRFDRKTRYGVMISSDVSKMLMTEDNQIWVLTRGQGVFIYDTRNEQLEQNSRYGAFFCGGVIGNDGLVYTVTIGGQLSVFRGNGQHLKSYQIEDFQLDKNPISVACSGSTIWLANNTSLMRLNPNENTVELQLRLPGRKVAHW